MLSLTNKHILLGITGGIAAYKSAELARLFMRAGAEVRVVMTRAATEFITPLTMQALTGHRVHLDLLDPEAEAAMGHIELARWADLVVVAPATADFLARITQAHADDILTTLILATPAPIALAPAMNQGMWADAGVVANVATLQQRGYQLLGPADGEQACGDVGQGRMLEPAQILSACAGMFDTGILAGRRLVITGGPTREAIDPVRFLSNHSSGKMAYALAAVAVELGAKVTLVSGPVALATPAGVKRVDVISAADMQRAVLEQVAGADVFIGVAAVADYRPEAAADSKIKKDADRLELTLVRNPDIISDVAALPARPMVVGFAAETDNLLDNARSKLQRKKLDLLFANDATATFNSDAIAVTLVAASGEEQLPAGSKTAVARLMLEHIAARLAGISETADSPTQPSGSES
jgi:phosphopantothenoylcysteine decarboxylase/phosphopantothenate--cysteine ligase